MVSTHRFRWAELQLAIFLDEDTPFRLAEDVISELDRLEEEVGLPDLDLVYDEIYQKNTRVGTHDRENVKRTFSFLLYSFVNWNIHDLANAISLGLDGTLNLAIDASYVLDICSNFIVVDHSDYVQFAHLSVSEYLKRGRSAILFCDMDAHAQIAEVCLAYVISPGAQEIVKKGELDRRPFPRRLGDQLRCALHMYAFTLGLEHCELASVVRSQKGRALCSLFTASISMVEINPISLTWIKSARNATAFPVFPPNWTAQSPVSHYRIKRGQIEADPQDAFFAACAYGFTDVLQDIMSSVVNVDVNRRNEKGAPGIWVASRYGHFSVVELLLDEGAEVDIRDNQFSSTPLYAAGIGGHANIVALLLSRGADASARFDYYDGPSMLADSTDSEYRIERVGPETYEKLLHAVARGWGGVRGMHGSPMRESKMQLIVGLLLKHGASTEAVNSELETPLHIACRYNNVFAVSILLHHGALGVTQDLQGNTPLLESLTAGSIAAMELILKKASIADIVRRNDKAHSVLSLSLRHNARAAFQLLKAVNLEAARELGTQEGDEFVALSQVLKRIGHHVRGGERDMLQIVAGQAGSQRSVVNCLHAIAEKVDLGKLEWEDADLRDKLRKEGASPDLQLSESAFNFDTPFETYSTQSDLSSEDTDSDDHMWTELGQGH